MAFLQFHEIKLQDNLPSCTNSYNKLHVFIKFIFKQNYQTQRIGKVAKGILPWEISSFVLICIFEVD